MCQDSAPIVGFRYFNVSFGCGFILRKLSLMYFSIFLSGSNIYFWISFLPSIVSRNLSSYWFICSFFLSFRIQKSRLTLLSSLYLSQKLILLIGTKLHHVVVKLAVEIMDSCPPKENHQFKLGDGLFWFGKPWLLLWLIQFISFQVSNQGNWL